MLLLIILSFTGILYIVINKVYSKHWDKGLNVDIKLSPKEIIEGNNAELIEVISKESILPLPSVQIKFKTSKYFDFKDHVNSSITDNYYRSDVFSIIGNKKITRTLDFMATKRGYYTVDSIDIIATNIFLSEHYVSNNKKNSSCMYVYPKTIPQKEINIPLDNIIGDYVAKNSLNEDPFEFKGIRNYQPYDNFSAINWKVSAKSNTLMVNQHNSTSSLDAEILFNADLLNFQSDIFGEMGIRLVATIAEKICKFGIPLKFRSNAYDIITNSAISIPASTGPNQLRLINESLSKIDLLAPTDDFISLLANDNKKESLKIIVSGDYRDSLLNAYSDLKGKNKKVLLIIPTHLNDKKINIESVNDIFIWEVKDND